MKKLQSTFLNMFLSLTLISVVAGAGLAYVYNVTKEPIEQANAKKQAEAIKAVLPEGAVPAEQADTVNGNTVYIATDANGAFTGMAIEVSSDGFGGKVKMMVGFDREGSLIDYSILELAETPGLGSKLTTWFREKSDIRGAKVADGEVKVSKDGGRYDAITAATISSRAFMVGINNAMETYTAAIEKANACDATTAATVQQADSAATDTTKTEEATL